MLDEKKVDYASKVPGVMHACGHGRHVATLARQIISDERQIIKAAQLLARMALRLGGLFVLA